MSQFTIESNVPIAPRTVLRGPRKYPFGEMKIGDSFFVADGTKGIKSIGACARRVGIHVIVRKDTKDGVKGVRVHRVEPKAATDEASAG